MNKNNPRLSMKSQETILEIFKTNVFAGHKPFEGISVEDIRELIKEILEPENGLKNLNWVDYQSQWLEVYAGVDLINEDGETYAVFTIGAEDTSGRDSDVSERIIKYPMSLGEL